MRPMDSINRFGDGICTFIVLAILSVSSLMSLSACQSVKIAPGGQNQPSGSGHVDTQPKGQPGPLSNTWQVSYSVNGETRSSHMTLVQNGTQFEGSGTDDENATPFVVDSGVFSGNSVLFHKRYHVDENPNLPPIIYQGKFEMANSPNYSGPYMSGSYKFNKSGQVVEGQFDAQVDSGSGTSNSSGSGSTAPPPQQSPQPAAGGNRRPDLSGKWDAGYEFEFKTVHSSMFLEQSGTKIVGHGMDKATKEAFKVEGTYKFPEVKMYVTYYPVKGPKGKAKPERKLEFRGSAASVNDADYQGTRMEGKTAGGGMWMAEQVR